MEFTVEVQATPAIVWRRVVLLPVQLVLPYVAWQTVILIVASVIVGWDEGSGESLIAAALIAAGWVMALGYVYVALACGLARFAVWAGCVRALTHASPTQRALA